MSQLDELTKPLLQQLLRERGLKVSGTKDQLLARLRGAGVGADDAHALLDRRGPSAQEPSSASGAGGEDDHEGRERDVATEGAQDPTRAERTSSSGGGGGEVDRTEESDDDVEGPADRTEARDDDPEDTDSGAVEPEDGQAGHPATDEADTSSRSRVLDLELGPLTVDVGDVTWHLDVIRGHVEADPARRDSATRVTLERLVQALARVGLHELADQVAELADEVLGAGRWDDRRQHESRAQRMRSRARELGHEVGRAPRRLGAGVSRLARRLDPRDQDQ